MLDLRSARQARVEKLVGVNYEVSCMSVVDSRLGFGLPRGVRFRIGRESADEFDLVEVSKFSSRHVLQFASDHEVKQLFVGHLDFLLGDVSAYVDIPHAHSGQWLGLKSLRCRSASATTEMVAQSGQTSEKPQNAPASFR